MQNPLILPKKSLGQNFLRDENIARKIVSAIQPDKQDQIVEIGPGSGILTKYLIESGAEVIAVEIDHNLAELLAQKYSDRDNFQLLHGDILKLPMDTVLPAGGRWKLLGNLPYHITSPVLFRIFEHRQFFSEAVFMVQKEVAQRIVAPAGSKVYGILSVFSQYHAEVTKLFEVSPRVFYPPPEVTSALVKWKFKSQIPLSASDQKLFRALVKQVFSQRRKMLRNSLRQINDLTVDWSALTIDFEKRPEQLTVEEFIELTRQIAAQYKDQTSEF
ncbi:MAG: 16S rRNA (adenine(1518)-N(6)/adenine(1519)-N(6))-dimethyltransferase RsmA [bacterium]|nr:16S rRNA (adenine(1518)-N(6)/adenine(1519)-N(6))-dimethyltransferase RsmA [bacterium]